MNLTNNSSVDGYLGCFHVLAIVNNAAKNISIQISLCDPSFNSFEHITSSGISESNESDISESDYHSFD
jgi:hypothetical protein